MQTTTTVTKAVGKRGQENWQTKGKEMAVNPNQVPVFSKFQKTHVGTVLTGLSGILPFNKQVKAPPVSPKLTTPGAIIGSHFHIFKGL